MEPCGIDNCEACPWPDCILDCAGKIKLSKACPHLKKVYVVLPPDIEAYIDGHRKRMTRAGFVLSLIRRAIQETQEMQS